ncbi:hypothetical protein BN159_2018 [Streptomyces davaonensis JCM 4913]|uniref:Uncharacterized protein n=1 Tax=Streptomyces davaonensis (strain DSM 101723 / JCM 4913 / KCC S-0913 / 768) TaxID=1214101 RepID=K4QZR5_STRDJ|nr:hypothetical protein BN159_2018 [Streptomyces davaonensis JCM 4913]
MKEALVPSGPVLGRPGHAQLRRFLALARKSAHAEHSPRFLTVLSFAGA